MVNRTFEEIKNDIDHANNINDAEALLRYATELDVLATPQALAAAGSSRGWAHCLRGDYTAALEHLHRALALHEELGERSGVAINTRNIGIVYRNTGDYPAALEHYHRALALYEELGDRRGVARVAVSIGNVHNSIGDYPAALEQYHRALALCEEIGQRHFAASISGNIGNVFGNTDNYPAALEHYHRALAIHEELGDRSGIARVTASIGNVHARTGDYSAALEHLHRALTLHEELGNRIGVAHATVNILEIYVDMGSDHEAQALIQATDAMQIDDPELRIHRDLQRAALQERSGDLDGAAVTLQHAVTEAETFSVRSKSAQAHKALRDLAQKRNDFAAYIEHNNEYTRITEEINGKETTLKLAMQAKQREIDAERKEIDKHLAVLHSTLPRHIADRVARGETVNDHYENAAVLFLDIVGFTTMSEQLSSGEVVQLLGSVFTALDDVCKNHDMVKIKTIGDSYMAVAFPTSVPHFVRNDTSVPRSTRDDTSVPRSTRDDTSSLDLSTEDHVIPSETRNVSERAASAAVDMLHAISHIISPASSPVSSPVQVRIGMHSGPVTAGVIGTQRMQYDVWGDTVNVASRMENTSEPGRIHVSEAFARSLAHARDDNRTTLMSDAKNVIPSMNEEQGVNSPFPIPYSLRERGALEIKGKGTMTTFWLEEA